MTLFIVQQFMKLYYMITKCFKNLIIINMAPISSFYILLINLGLKCTFRQFLLSSFVNLVF